LETLDKYYFTDNLAQPRKWNPQNHWVGGGQFGVLWFEREELIDHASFKLEPGGGSLYLLDEAGIIIDQVTYPKQYRNVSYGRTDDTGNQWAYFTAFSPQESNTGKQQAAVPTCTKPKFTISGGFYNSPTLLQFAAPYEGETIYYTTDASEPTAQSDRYIAGQNIPIDQTKCVRAITLSDSHLPSEIVTHTYFVNTRKFTLPVVSLVTEEKNLKDNTIGIYVNGTNGLVGNGADTPVNWNQDWDRPANMELYDTTGVMQINQEIDISISGGWSRAHPQKSLKLSPRKKFGDNRLRYDFFASKPNRKYKDIQIRNSGNDFWNTMMRDALMQSLIIDRMDIDYQAYEPAICFMNGEYYGIQNLRERTNKDYLYSNYGLEEDEIVLLDHTQAPSDSEYLSFLNFMRNNDLSNSSIYKTVEEWMDIDSYSYYMMAQMYYANTDWPHNNYKVWMKNDGAGKWRWILFDTDFGFNNNQNQNAVTYVLQSSDDKITTPLRRLLTITDFKNRFLTRYAIHLSSTFEPNRVLAFIDSLSAKIRPEMAYHKQKWGGGNFESELNIMKTFAKERSNKMMEFLSSYFFQSTPILNIDLRSNHENSTYLFNNDSIKENSIRLKYFKNQAVKMEASEAPGYHFSHWELSDGTISTLIESASSWHYWDNSGQPSGNWKETSYDDSAWKTGNAPWGSGNFTKNTTISYGNDGNNKYPTAYFRKTITLNNWNDLSDFRLYCYADDGAAVYVNGQEIGRINLPAGNLTFNTYTTNTNNSESEEWTVPKSLFHEGENTIAVEVHQCNATSSDLIFDGNLTCQNYSNGEVQQITTPVYSFTLTENISLKAVYEPDSSDLQTTVTSSPVRVYSLFAENVVQIEHAAGKSVQIYDLIGRPVYRNRIENNNERLDLAFLTSGLYIVVVDNRSFKIKRM
jgi:hypothetical protein